jgi:Domain of unknown function (DUF222)
VLDALSAPADAEDPRTHGQRYHDALQEAMKRLLASGLLPERAGQPVKAWVHVSLAELRALDYGSALEGEWITAVRVRWAAHRAAASEGAGDGAAWLDGDAARAATCDATLTPVVTGNVEVRVLDDLVKLCVRLEHLDHDAGLPADGTQADAETPASPSREALQQAIIGKAADLLSGPGGLASFLRTRQLGARLAGPSLPLDIGYSKTIPPGIRNAVILRDRRCRWPGGCHQPASACEVHHVKHKANGPPRLNLPPTSTRAISAKGRRRASRAACIKRGPDSGQAGQAPQVDAGDPVDRDEHHEHVVAYAAADHRAQLRPVHRHLGHLPPGPARAADAHRRGHLRPEYLDQHPADRVTVQHAIFQRIHHRDLHRANRITGCPSRRTFRS